MQHTLRPSTVTGMAFAATSIIAVAPIAGQLPNIQTDRVSPIAAAVELTSGVVDTWVDAVGGSAAFLGGFATAAPGGLLAAGQSLVDAPGHFPTVAVDLLGGLIGIPDLNNQPASLFSGAAGPLFMALAQTLPAPLGASGQDLGLFMEGMAGVNLLLRSLWGSGDGIVDQSTGHVLGSFVPNLAAGVEAAPGQLLSAVASAITNPEDIPGLFTHMLGWAFAPSPDLIGTPSLLSQLAGPPVVALTQLLPEPLGGVDGLFLEGFKGINDLMTKAFDLLPTAVTPSIIGLDDLVSLPGSLSSSLSDLGTDIGNLLGGIPLVGDAFQWILDALMGLL